MELRSYCIINSSALPALSTVLRVRGIRGSILPRICCFREWYFHWTRPSKEEVSSLRAWPRITWPFSWWFSPLSFAPIRQSVISGSPRNISTAAYTLWSWLLSVLAMQVLWNNMSLHPASPAGTLWARSLPPSIPSMLKVFSDVWGSFWF